jgi:hypothetical protein
MRLLIIVPLAVLAFAVSLRADQIHRNPFEGRQPVWQRGPADATFQVQTHEVTGDTAHNGQQSEHLKLTAEAGAFIHFIYPLGRADVTEDLILALWVKANRPGTQLLARVVVPRERDPKNLEQPLTVMLRGDVLQRVGRWDRLAIRKPLRLMQEQQALLRADLKRDVNFDGAYVDQLVLNVLGGRGLNEVWIDDLEAGPVQAESTSVPANPESREFKRAPAASPAVRGGNRNLFVELQQDRLLVNRKPFLVRGIRYSDLPLEALRNVGFNTLWIDPNAPAEVLEQAVKYGFLLVPEVPVLEENPRFATPTALQREVVRHPFLDAVLFWHVGNGMTAEQAGPLKASVQTIRMADPGRPISGNIWDGFKSHSHNLEMLGVHRWPLMTGLELAAYREWLVQRAQLAEGGTYLWTWIQTHLPEWYSELVHGQGSAQPFTEPVGPQPEQIRLMTYLALSAGYRGLGFWSDRFLANSHQGRDRLLTMALLNQELEMLEPMLASARDISWINTRHPEIRAAVMTCENGLLVLPMWLGVGAQYVPGQLTVNNLEIIVPGAPQEAQAWEVSPGDVRSLEAKRVAGGMKITVPEFGMTTAVLLTADVNTVDGGVIGRLQQTARRTSRLAGQYAYDLGVETLRKVETVNQQLEQSGQAVPGAPRLLEESRRRLEAARAAWTRGSPADHRIAYLEAQRGLRPLRLLMRAHWDRAVALLDSPVASPYATSYYALPRHWRFMQDIRNAQVGPSALPHGDFELMSGQAPEAWSVQEVKLDEVEFDVARVTNNPKEGKQCLRLEVKPRNEKAPPAALERTFLAVHSPQFRLPPGSLVQISGWIRVPKPIEASVDGVLFYDSIGGEPLAVRLTQKTAWRQFKLYRQVPANGVVSVTMALTGVGTAFFDDVRIEPLTVTPAIDATK